MRDNSRQILILAIVVLLIQSVFGVYHQKMGRFMMQDPLGYVDGTNLYEYVNSKPLKFVDPYGLLSTANPCTLAAQGFTAEEIAEILGISLAAVYEATKGKCDPVPPISTPKPKCPPRKTGDCAPEQHAALQNAVNMACKYSGKTACKKNHSMTQLLLNLATNTSCALARESINATCFKGGNPTHRQAANDAWGAVANCAKEIWGKSKKNIVSN